MSKYRMPTWKPTRCGGYSRRLDLCNWHTLMMMNIKLIIKLIFSQYSFATNNIFGDWPQTECTIMISWYSWIACIILFHISFLLFMSLDLFAFCFSVIVWKFFTHVLQHYLHIHACFNVWFIWKGHSTSRSAWKTSHLSVSTI